MISGKEGRESAAAPGTRALDPFEVYWETTGGFI